MRSPVEFLRPLFSPPPYLFAGNEEVRDDLLRMQALLLAKAAEIVVGENPAASGRLLDDAAPQGIGVVVIGEVEHVEAPELDLHFQPCASLGFSVPPESDGEGISVRLETREVEVIVLALGEWIVGKPCDVPIAESTTCSMRSSMSSSAASLIQPMLASQRCVWRFLRRCAKRILTRRPRRLATCCGVDMRRDRESPLIDVLINGN